MHCRVKELCCSQLFYLCVCGLVDVTTTLKVNNITFMLSHNYIHNCISLNQPQLSWAALSPGRSDGAPAK